MQCTQGPYKFLTFLQTQKNGKSSKNLRNENKKKMPSISIFCAHYASKLDYVCSLDGIQQPYFEYCSPLWDNCGNLLKGKLQRFQSRAGRVLTGANYDIHSADIIQTLSWDTLDARRLRAKSTLMYKILNDGHRAQP